MVSELRKGLEITHVQNYLAATEKARKDCHWKFLKLICHIVLKFLSFFFAQNWQSVRPKSAAPNLLNPKWIAYMLKLKKKLNTSHGEKCFRKLSIFKYLNFLFSWRSREKPAWNSERSKDISCKKSWIWCESESSDVKSMKQYLLKEPWLKCPFANESNLCILLIHQKNSFVSSDPLGRVRNPKTHRKTSCSFLNKKWASLRTLSDALGA